MNLALFDFDGTITFKDSFKPFLYFSGTPARLAIGSILFSPLVAAYKLRILSPRQIRPAVISFGFRGRREAEIRRIGSRFAQEVLPGTIRPKALEQINWHKQQGDVVVVVSSALD